jgi:protein-tyrosine phosphatase
MKPSIRVLFVCTGNICRSPTAEGVFLKLTADGPLAGHVEVDSAGTHGYHAGAAPDPRAIEHAAKRGYDISGLRARQVSAADLDHFDYVLVMDELNVRNLRAMSPTRLKHKIERLLDYGGADHESEVPDPYYGEARDFERALDLIEAGCRGLHDYLLDQLKLSGKIRA